MVKKLPAKARDRRDMGSISESGRPPEGGHGNSLQYTCLENPIDRGAWWATVHGVAKSQTRLKRLSTAHTKNVSSAGVKCTEIIFPKDRTRMAFRRNVQEFSALVIMEIVKHSHK